jgi:hypothetical protein
MKKMTLQQLKRQQATALITAIGFIAILSILGTVVLTATTRDMSLSGGFLPSLQAFYTTDRAVEYSMNRDIIINLTPGDTLNLIGENAKDVDGNDIIPIVTHNEIIEGTSGGTLVSGLVTDLGPSELPPSMAAIHGSDFGANMYHVETESKVTTSSGDKKSRVDASIVRLFKIDDDTIFRTSGGG